MPDISFSFFNPRSFEQFAQALAGRVLGSGLLVFGDGPDGGREASFEGRVPYPSTADQWDGLIVLQAKFHMRPTNDGKDASWLVAQIANEAAKFTHSHVPNYYVIITNIRLSGVRGKERKGGQQKVDEAFQQHLKPLGVKAMHVWHEEKIATLLDAEPDLLRSYGAWLSPREVLAAVFESVTDRLPDFGTTILRLLMRELREQRATRLQQAGHVDDAATPLESVFVDLPYGVPFEAAESHMELLSELRADSSEAGLLADLLAFTSLKLDPLTMSATFPESSGPLPVRHLVLGGPGQGKSTISQFLAQVARARLLHDEPRELLTPEVRPVLDAIRTRMAELGLPIDGPRRYPLRVDLPAFADALSKFEKDGGTLSLLEFLADRIGTATNSTIDVAVMRRWLKAYPWLLILDGLDEVPPSGNRARLLAAITDFWDEATPVAADVAMVITTRPQGYNDDLDPSFYLRHEMQKLDAPRALAYARGVATLKIQEKERRDRVLARLEAAAENSTTALLMTSPLQVAILLQLVDQRGSAPTDRWTLFDEYLAVVIKREQEKHGEASRIVKKWAFVIDGMLRRAGLLLHVEAERRGGAQAYLTMERLHALARDTLLEDGHSEDVLDAHATEITAAATDRLVFLEQRVEGQVEFEVRSLQEFMAAAELMAGDDAAVQERLKAVAGRNHWQHVYRIAASKAFSARDAAKYRDTVITANLLIENEDAAGLAVRRGGALALELLADGVAHDQPKFRRMLMQQAAGLLKLGPQTLDPRLIDVFAAGPMDEALQLITPCLSVPSTDERLSAWQILFGLIVAEGDAADLLAVEHWPCDPAERLGIAANAHLPPEGTQAASLIIDAFADADIPVVADTIIRASRADKGRVDTVNARLPYLSVLTGRRQSQFEIGLLEVDKPTLRFRLMSIEGARIVGYDTLPSTSAWAPALLVTRFLQEPTASNLGEFTKALSRTVVRDAADQLTLPWPLDTALMMVRSGADPHLLAANICLGGLGDTADWLAAEARWRSKGITSNDLDLWCEGTFFDGRVANIGAPFANALNLSIGRKGRDGWLVELLNKLVVASPGAPASFMRRIATFALSGQPMTEPINTERLRATLIEDPFARVWPRAKIVEAIAPDALTDPDVVSLLVAIGEGRGYPIESDFTAFSVASTAALFRRAPGNGMADLALGLFALEPAKLSELALELRQDIARLTPEVTSSAPLAVLQYLNGSITTAEALAAAVSAGDEAAQQALVGHAERPETDPVEAMEILITMIHGLNRANIDVRSEALNGLRRLLDQRTSELSDCETWKMLGLPASLHAMIRPDDGDKPCPSVLPMPL